MNNRANVFGEKRKNINEAFQGVFCLRTHAKASNLVLVVVSFLKSKALH